MAKNVDLGLLGKGLRKALASGLNRTGYAAKRQFFVEMSKVFGIAESAARAYGWRRIEIIRARENKLQVVIQTKRKNRGVIPLIAFSPEHSRSMPGASVEIYRGRREFRPGTFIAKGSKSRRFSVFKRVGRGRLPITTSPGVPVEKMFIEVVPQVDKWVKANLDRYILAALKKEIKNGQI